MAIDAFRKPGIVNRALLITMIVLTLLLGLGLYWGHEYRTRTMAKNALIEGQKAMACRNWTIANAKFRLYLSKYPEDVQVLNQYAFARLSIRPQTQGDLLAAIGVYRRLIRLSPSDSISYRKLATLYDETGNYTELLYIAQRWIKFAPDDLKAGFWLAKANVLLRRNDDARNILLPLVQRMEKEKGKYAEFTEVCLLLGGIDSQSENRESRLHAVQWFNRAVKYHPDHAEPYLNRARYYLQTLYENDQPMETKIKSARADLARAEKLEIADPKIRLSLCNEWLKLNDLDKIEQQLSRLEKIDPDVIDEYFVDKNDYLVAKYQVAAEVAARKDEIQKGCDLSDKILAQLSEPENRVLVLPVAIKLYAAGGHVLQAGTCLNEYFDILRATEKTPELSEEASFLQAMVTWANHKPYRLINDLEPLVGRNPNLPRIWALLAEAYIQTDQPRRAVMAMEKYLRMVPDDYGRTFRLLQLYEQTGKWEQVISVADRLVAYKPNDDNRTFIILHARYEILLHSTNKDNTKDNSVEMEKIDQSLLGLAEKYPEKVQIPIFRAQLRTHLKQFNQARQILQAAIDRCKEKYSAELEMVRLDMSENKISQAVERCRNLCKRQPDKPDAWLLLADNLVNSQQLTAAKTTLETAINELSSIADRHTIERRLAELDLSFGDRSAGILRFESLAAEDKDDVQTRMYLLSQPEIYRNSVKAQKLINDIRDVEGDAGLRWRLYQSSLWLSQKEWRSFRDRIAANLTRCIEADPSWADPLILMGQFSERLGDLPTAEDYYRRALLNDPARTQVVDHLLAFLEKRNRSADVRDLLNQLPKELPDRYLKRACFAMKTGDVTLAVEDLHRQIEADPKNIEAYLLLAKLTYEKSKNLDSAFKILDLADRQESEALAILSLRCSLLYEEHKNDQARQLLDRAVAKNNNYESLLLRATFLESLGLLAQAEKDYQQLKIFDRNGQSYERLGQFYADHQRFKDALSVWEEGVRKYPENNVLKRRWMKGLFLTGSEMDRKKAMAVLVEQEKKYPDDADILYVRGLVLLDENTPASIEKARKLFQRVVEIDPSIIDAYCKLIGLVMRNHDYGKARDLVIAAQSDNPGNIQLLLTRAQIECATGNYTNAVEMARLLLKDDPQNMDAIKILVEASVESGDRQLLTDTSNLIDQKMASMPKNVQMHLAKVQILRSQNQVKEAITHLEAFMADTGDKNNLQLLLVLAELYRIDGNDLREVEVLKKAKKIAPASSAVIREEIYRLFSRKDYAQLVNLIDDYRIRKDCDPYLVVLASSLLASTETPEYQQHTEILLEDIVSCFPSLIEAKLQLAWLNFQTKKYDQAEALYRQILDLEPSNIQAINNLAWILSQVHHDSAAALAMVNRGIDLTPDEVDLRDTRAEIYLAAGRLQEARDDYAQCVNRSSQDSSERAQFLLKLARVTAKLGDSRRTEDSVRQAMDIDQRNNVFSETERKEIENLRKLRAR